MIWGMYASWSAESPETYFLLIKAMQWKEKISLEIIKLLS